MERISKLFRFGSLTALSALALTFLSGHRRPRAGNAVVGGAAGQSRAREHTNRPGLTSAIYGKPTSQTVLRKPFASPLIPPIPIRS